MALPNGELQITPLNPQHAYPVDKRMQTDTLNSRDSISPYIRWRGMQVHVLENDTTYMLKGGVTNEFWTVLGEGSGGGGSTFVGQFETVDLLPATASPGDYAYVGDSENFLQYNWDNISGKWVSNATNLSPEKFYTSMVANGPVLEKVIFTKTLKDEVVEEDGAQVIYPSEMRNFIFTGSGVVLEGVGYADEENEFSVENRTDGTISIITNGGVANTEFAVSTTIPVGGKKAFKGNGTTWDEVEVNEIAPSNSINSYNAITTVDENGIETISNIQDVFTKEDVNFKEVLEVPTLVDGIINIEKNGKYYKRVLKEYNLGEFNVLPENTASENAVNFAFAQTVIPHDSKIILPTGVYFIDDVEITKSGIYNFSGVTFINDLEVSGAVIKVLADAEYCEIIGLKLEYQGIFYTSSTGHTGTYGISKNGIRTYNDKTILLNCHASGFSNAGFIGDATSLSLHLNDCTANNNGYAGGMSSGFDFQVIGGEYNENGGANANGGGYGDGYGIIGNVARNGNFKVIGVNCSGNRTRNIDSHTGDDIIIANNYCTDAGKAIPQWFNVEFTTGHGIRLTQIINRSTVSGNIVKNCTGGGIAFDGGNQPGDYIEDIIVIGNVLLNNRYQIFIKPILTKSAIISSNYIHGESGSRTELSLFIDPYGGSGSDAIIESITISNNYMDNRLEIKLPSDSVSPIQKPIINLSDNKINSTFIVYSYNYEINVNVTDNHLIKDVQILNTNTKSFFNLIDNTIDRENDTLAFSPCGSFSGFSKIHGNNIINSETATTVVLTSNTDFQRNYLRNCNIVSPATFNIRTFNSSNIKIIGNYIGSEVQSARSMHIAISNTVIIKDNKYFNDAEIEYPTTTGTANKRVTSVGNLLFDPLNGRYDLGITALSGIDLGTYSFKRGDVMKNLTPVAGGYKGYVCVTAGAPGTWKEYGLIGAEKYIAITSTYDLSPAPTDPFKLYNTSSADFLGSPDDSKDWYINRGAGNAHTVAIDIAYGRAGTTDIYRREYTAGAWTSWVKVGESSYLGLSDTTDTTFTNKAFFVPSVSAFETGITLENPAIFRPVFTINDTTGSAWTASAIGDAVQLIRIVDAGGGTLAGATGMEFKKLTIMNESASTFTLLHEDTGTTATNRFNFADSNNLVLPVNGWVDLMYVNGRYRRGL